MEKLVQILGIKCDTFMKTWNSYVSQLQLHITCVEALCNMTFYSLWFNIRNSPFHIVRSLWPFLPLKWYSPLRNYENMHMHSLLHTTRVDIIWNIFSLSSFCLSCSPTHFFFRVFTKYPVKSKSKWRTATWIDFYKFGLPRFVNVSVSKH